MSTTPAPDEHPNPNPAAAAVILLGGPPDWHGTHMHTPIAALDDVAGHGARLHHPVDDDPDDVDADGLMLISDHTPERDEEYDDVDPRAHYSPDPPPADARIWWFRGWFPTTVGRPEWRRPSPADREPVVEIDLDDHGCPAAWTLPAGEEWTLDRLQVHWLYEGEGALGGNVGVWQVRAHTDRDSIAGWELIHDPAVGWAAGRIPASGPE